MLMSLSQLAHMSSRRGERGRERERERELDWHLSVSIEIYQYSGVLFQTLIVSLAPTRLPN